MKRQVFLRFAGAAIGGWLIGPALTGCGGGDEDLADAALPVDRSAVTADPAVPAVPAAAVDLSPEEIAGLLFMREEEKLAHDVYVALFSRWGHNVFNQIAQSEAQHAETMRQLVLAHGLVDPAAGNPPGVFVNTDLQAMHDALVARGQASLVEALKVGCLIEEKDIQDIHDKIEEVEDEPDVVQAYENLLCGSRNHLRAFNRTLVNQGRVYAPEVITQAEWDAIANSPNEACGG